jgi:hypothetical protein
VNVTLTISVEHPSELPAAVLALAASLSDGAGPAVLPQGASVSVEPAKRGRKPKAEVTEAPTVPEAETSSPAEVVAARIAAVSAESAPTATQAAPAASAADNAPAVAIDKKVVTEALVALVKKHGRDVCGALCRAHGAPNLSALAESTYPAVYAEAQKLLATDVVPA